MENIFEVQKDGNRRIFHIEVDVDMSTEELKALLENLFEASKYGE